MKLDPKTRNGKEQPYLMHVTLCILINIEDSRNYIFLAFFIRDNIYIVALFKSIFESVLQFFYCLGQWHFYKFKLIKVKVPCFN